MILQICAVVPITESYRMPLEMLAQHMAKLPTHELRAVLAEAPELAETLPNVVRIEAHRVCRNRPAEASRISAIKRQSRYRNGVRIIDVFRTCYQVEDGTCRLATLPTSERQTQGAVSRFDVTLAGLAPYEQTLDMRFVATPRTGFSFILGLSL
jgi:hypothetical protein